MLSAFVDAAERNHAAPAELFGWAEVKAMNKLWKTCPKCSFLNLDRTHCIECDTDLRDIKPEDLAEPKSEKPCLWKLNDLEFDDYWNTDCKEAYNFMHGGPVENMYRYCPGCGRRIKLEVRVEPL